VRAQTTTNYIDIMVAGETPLIKLIIPRQRSCRGGGYCFLPIHPPKSFYGMYRLKDAWIDQGAKGSVQHFG